MKELKTLKDMRKDRIKYFKKKLESFGCPDSYLEQTARSMALFLEKQDKQEAIKWVKDIRESTPSTSQKKEDIRCFSESWIKNFFNITEENLK